MAYRTRALEADEWRVLRDLRLRALGDTPQAFRATLEEERALSEAQWRERALQDARGEVATCRLAVTDGTDPASRNTAPEGIAVGLGEALTRVEGRAELAAMWVAPAARGSGIAAVLVEEVVAWARARGHRHILAGINMGNERALPFYLRLGFEMAAEQPTELPEIELIRILR